MKQEHVYSEEWFRALDKTDPQLSAHILGRIISRKSQTICTICCSHAKRDYAILGARCLSPVRLCRICHDLYLGTFGKSFVIPFVGCGAGSYVPAAKRPKRKPRGGVLLQHPAAGKRGNYVRPDDNKQE